jgi:signal transduction histidine kinase
LSSPEDAWYPDGEESATGLRFGIVVVRILLRPVRLETWRELAYLALGLPLSMIAFGLELAVLIAGGVLLITLLGVPILLAGAYMNRFFADLERRRAGFLLRERIDGRYRDTSGARFWRHARIVGGDPQTWKDFVGVLVLVFLGFVFGVGAVSAWAGLLGWVSLPLWWWIPPPGTAVDFGSWSVDSWSHALELSAAALLATIPLAWIVAGLARGQASLMRALLAPGAGERVAALERSRAAVVRTEEEERRRLERDIHDGVQARLVALALDLGMARDKLEGGDTASAQTLVEEAHDEAKQTLATLRELVRGVHPAILADRGLDAALSALAARSPVPIDLDVDVERLPAAVETAAYFVVAEALANVAKHSDATRCDVRARVRNGNLVVEVSDDGAGGARLGAGSGLSGLADRVEALDGTLRVASPAGGPTIVVAEIPCGS